MPRIRSKTDAERDVGSLVSIQKGRKQVEREIFASAAEKVRVFGIELLDIRFKRINYNESVRPKIYDRMISERRQIAERFLSGHGCLPGGPGATPGGCRTLTRFATERWCPEAGDRTPS